MKQTSSPQNQAFLLFGLLFLFSFSLFAQVGIGNTDPNASSLLDIGDGTNANTKGLLIPRVNIPDLALPGPVTSPATGLLVYNTRPANAGFYYWDGSRWMGIDGGKNWQLAGNAGTLPATNFIGTTDNVNLRFRTNNADQFEITTDGKLRAFKAGTATEPLYSWSSSANMGMYAAAANVLAFSTASTERMRFLANGQVIVNGTTPLAGDRLTVLGSVDEYAINGITSGVNVAGVYGENVTTNGFGVYGNVGEGFGVLGESTGGGRGVQGSNSGAGLGVIGFSESTGVGVQGQNSGTGIGVAGFSDNAGVGVFAYNSGDGDGVNGIVSGAGDGVYGQNTGSGYGVHGLSTSSTSFGIKATHLHSEGTAILAVGADLGGGSYLPTTGISANGNEGSFAWGKVPDGTGVLGTGNNSTSIITNVNGGGIAGSGTRNGIFGYAGNGSVANGNRGNSAGIFMLDTDNDIDNNNSNNDNGIRATAILAGFDNLAVTGYPTLRDSYFGGYFSGGTQRSDGYQTSYAYVGLRYRTANSGRSSGNSTDFKIVGPGTVSTLINDDQNVPRIMFAPEAPEIVFQDYGIGQLINGQATIKLDPILKKSLHIDSQHPLKVFVTLEGDCNGIYVTNKSADGFTVKELQNGISNVPFSWQIVASRADTKDINGNVVSKHVGLRLPIGPGPLIAEAKQLELSTIDEKESLKERKERASNNVKGKQLNSAAMYNEQSSSSGVQDNKSE